MTYKDLEDTLFQRIQVLCETIWPPSVGRKPIEKWLNQFRDEKEKIHALFLLSRFMYFGSFQMKLGIKSLYRDLVKYPIISDLRRENNNTIDGESLEKLFNEELSNTRFLGLGNPSESGNFLLYYFRQENELHKDLFIHEHQILRKTNDGTTDVLVNPSIKRYIFIDDFCGSGTQANEYTASSNFNNIIKLKSHFQMQYLPLFATTWGKKAVRDSKKFDKVESIFELDETYKCFNIKSRYKANLDFRLDFSFAEELCRNYGFRLMMSLCSKNRNNDLIELCAARNALGFKDGQLLLGFGHNTPDNTLPIMWFEDKSENWFPVFKRYNKIL